MDFKNIYKSLASVFVPSHSNELTKLQAELNLLDTSIEMTGNLLSKIERISPIDVANNYSEVVQLRDSINDLNVSDSTFYRF